LNVGGKITQVISGSALPVTPFPGTSGDATSGEVTAPHCSSTNTTWMVFLYLDMKSGSGTNRGFRVVDNKIYAYLQKKYID
jgi:hypothetical protein